MYGATLRWPGKARRGGEDVHADAGAGHTSNLHTFNHLGNICRDHEQIDKAGKMHMLALEEYEEALEEENTWILNTVNNLGLSYAY